MEPCRTGGWAGRPLDAECLGCGHALFVHLRSTEVCWVCEGMEMASHPPTDRWEALDEVHRRTLRAWGNDQAAVSVMIAQLLDLANLTDLWVGQRIREIVEPHQ